MLSLHEELRGQPHPATTEDRPGQEPADGHQPELRNSRLLSAVAGQTGTGRSVERKLCGGGRFTVPLVSVDIFQCVRALSLPPSLSLSGRVGI